MFMTGAVWPVLDAAEVEYAGVAELGQRLCGNGAAPPAAAVYDDGVVLVFRQAGCALRDGVIRQRHIKIT